MRLEDGNEGKININTHTLKGGKRREEYMKKYGEWIEKVVVQVQEMEECFWKKMK